MERETDIRLTHLARTICRLPTLMERRRAVKRYEEKNGKERADQLRERVKTEWQAMKGNQ